MVLGWHLNFYVSQRHMKSGPHRLTKQLKSILAAFVFFLRFFSHFLILLLVECNKKLSVICICECLKSLSYLSTSISFFQSSVSFFLTFRNLFSYLQEVKLEKFQGGWRVEKVEMQGMAIYFYF